MLLIPALHFIPAPHCTAALPDGVTTGTLARNGAASSIPRFRGLEGGTPSMIPATQALLGDFNFPFRTKPPTVASSPNLWELLRFVSTVSHSLSTGER